MRKLYTLIMTMSIACCGLVFLPTNQAKAQCDFASGCTIGQVLTLSVNLSDGTPDANPDGILIGAATNPTACNAIISFTEPALNGMCAGFSLQTIGPGSGALYNFGASTNTTYQIVDDGDGTIRGSCEFQISITDDQPPVFDNCPSDWTVGTNGVSIGFTPAPIQVMDADANDCLIDFRYTGSTDVSGLGITATESCTPANVGITDLGVTTSTPGDVFNLTKGRYTETFEAVDDRGNESTCEFVIDVRDSFAPTVDDCPPSVTIGTDGTTIASIGAIGTATVTLNGADVTTDCQANIDFSAPSFNDNCGIGTIEEISAYSGSGAPLNCVAAVAIMTNTITDGVRVGAAGVNVVAQKGTSTFRYEFTDCGNTQIACEFTVTVVDNQATTLSACPASVTVGTDGTIITTAAGGVGPAIQIDNTDILTDCAVTVDYTLDFTIDDCPEGTTAYRHDLVDESCLAAAPIIATMNSQSCAEAAVIRTTTVPKGTSSFTYTFTDCSETDAVCTFTVTVEDNRPSRLTACPNDITLGTSGAIIAANPIATDIIVSGAITSDCAATVTWRVDFEEECPESTFSVRIDIDDQSCLNSMDAIVSAGTPVTSCADIPAFEEERTLPKGVTTAMYRFTDCSETEMICTFSITVVDDKSPAVTACPPSASIETDGTVVLLASSIGTVGGATVVVPATGLNRTLIHVGGSSLTDCAANVSWGIPVATDECPEMTITFMQSIPSYNMAGGPVCTVVPAEVFMGTQDFCSTNPVTTLASGLQAAGVTSANMPYPKGTTTNRYEFVDGSGDTVFCQFEITVEDNTPPALTGCPADITLGSSGAIIAGPGTNLTIAPAITSDCAANVTWQIDFTDNCPEMTSSIRIDVDDQSCVNADAIVSNVIDQTTCTLDIFRETRTLPKGVTTAMYEFTECSGSTSICTFSITVEDNQAPVYTICPPSITLNTDGTGVVTAGGILSGLAPTMVIDQDNMSNADCAAEVTWMGPFASDSCPEGTLTYTRISEDPNGNPISSIAMPEITTCEPPILKIDNRGSGFNFPKGTTTNLYTFTDCSLQTITCEFLVTVEDNGNDDPSFIECPPSITIGTSGNGAMIGSDGIGATTIGAVNAADRNITDCLVEIEWEDPVATDNCPEGTMQFTFINVDGSTPITTAFRDITPEGIAIPLNPAASLTTYVSGPMMVPTFNLSRNAGFTPSLSGLTDGLIFNKGVSTLIYEFTDCGMSEATCDFTVTVVDDQDPEFTSCPADVTFSTDGTIVAGGGGLFILSGSPITTDCAAEVSFQNPISTDNCPESSLVSYTVMYDDGTGPVNSFTLAPVPVVGSMAGPLATSSLANGGTRTEIQETLHFNAGLHNKGTSTHRFQIVDCGTANTYPFPLDATDPAICEFTVTVIDDQPVIFTSCPPSVTLGTNGIMAATTTGAVGPGAIGYRNAGAIGTDCAADVSWSAPVATDNCPEATITRVMMIEDLSAMTTNTSPVLSATYAMTQIFRADENATADAMSTFRIFPKGTSTITYNAVDCGGNAAVCSFEVTVEDDDMPIFTTCPPSITIGTDGTTMNISPIPTLTGAVGPGAIGFVSASAITTDCSVELSWTAPVATDNCAQNTISRVMMIAGGGMGTAGPVTSNSQVVVSPFSTSRLFPKGTSTITYSLEDCGNFTAVCSFTIEVQDNQEPSFTSCPPSITLGSDGSVIGTAVGAVGPGAIGHISASAISSDCSVEVSWTAPVATDNCPEATIGRIMTIEDLSANPATTTLGPVLTATYSGTQIFRADGMATADPFSTARSFPKGVSTVSYQILDCGGQTAACLFTVEVRDNQTAVYTSCPPSISLGTSGTVTATGTPVGPGVIGADPVFDITDCAAEVSWSVPVATDNCPQATVELILTYADPCMSGASAMMTAMSTEAVSTFHQQIVRLNPGPGTESGAFFINRTFARGYTTVRYELVDCSNPATTINCEFVVDVVDDQVPTLSFCPVNIGVIPLPAGECSAYVTWMTPEFNDNCDGNGLFGEVSIDGSVDCSNPSLQGTIRNGHIPAQAAADCNGRTLTSGNSAGYFVAGTHQVQYKYVDLCEGNGTAYCDFTVTISPDNQDPEASCPETIRVVVLDGGGNGVLPANQGSGISTDNCPFNLVETSPQILVDCNDIDLGAIETFASAAARAAYVAPPMTSFSILFEPEGAFTQCGSAFAIVTYFITDATAAITGATGLNTYVLTATDAGGNTGTVTCQFLVLDTEEPEPNCPVNQISVNLPDMAGATVVLTPAMVTALGGIDGSSTDNCMPIVEAVVSVEAIDCNDIGAVATYVISATDASGNCDTRDCTIEVIDNVAPGFSTANPCPPNILTITNANSCADMVSWALPVATDNAGLCTPPVLVRTDMTGLVNTGSAAPVGTYTIVYEATDGSGNTTVCSFEIDVRDGVNPVVVACPAGPTVQLNSSCQVTIPDVTGIPTFTDDCEASSLLILSQDIPAGTAIPTSICPASEDYISVDVVATDLSGNQSTCTIVINVLDVDAPSVVNCPNITTTANATVCEDVVVYPDPTFADNCAGTVSVMRTSGGASGSTFTVAGSPHNVVYTATDCAGNMTTCGFTITVTDNQAPVVSDCPAIITTTNAGTCADVVNYALPTFADNCDGLVTGVHTGGPSTGSSLAPGIYNVSYTYIDNAGNGPAVCTFTITVNDNENPGVTCPAEQTITVNSSCTAIVPDFTGLVTASDNCPGFGMTQSPVSGSSIHIGASPVSVTVTVTDASGNTANATCSIELIDNEQPAVSSCPSVASLNTDPGMCTAELTYNNPEFSDNCSLAGVVWSSGGTMFSTNGTTSQETFGTGITTVVWIATDASGNTNSCSFTVQVFDNENPGLTCPANETFSLPGTACVATVTWGPPMSNDNCPNHSTVRTDLTGLTNGGTAMSGTYVLQFTTTDASGNAVNCNFTVTVLGDMIPPTITCPGNINIANDPGQCNAVVSWSITAADVNDNCTPDPVLLGNVQVSPQGPGLFNVGTTNITYETSDSAGNTGNCTFSVTVNDTENPVINACPGGVTVCSDQGGDSMAGDCQAIISWAAPTAADNCSIASFVATGIPGGNMFPVGPPTQIKYVATDVNGLMSTCTFDVKVIDCEDPGITCPANMVINNDPGMCGATVNFAPAAVSDNCTAAGSIATVATPASGSFFAVGVHLVTITATDGAGNQDNCGFSITVNDNEAPTINGCPADISMGRDPGECFATITFMRPTATDNCALLSYIETIPPFSGPVFNPTVSQIVTFMAPAGTTQVTYVASDGTLQSICSFFVKVTPDNTPPTITCPANITIPTNVSPTDCQAFVTWDPVAASDDCTPAPLINITPNSTSGVFSLGETSITYVATDASANTAACTLEITVIDILPPVIVGCPVDVTWFAGAGQCQTTVFYIPPTFDDNCGLASIDFTYAATCGDPNKGWQPATNGGPVTNANPPGPVPGTIFPTGCSNETSLHYLITDNNGNTATCGFNVVVLELDPPSIICPADITLGTSGTVYVGNAIVTGTNTMNISGDCDVTVNSGAFTEANLPLSNPATYGDICEFGGVPSACPPFPMSHTITNPNATVSVYGGAFTSNDPDVNHTFLKGTSTVRFTVTDDSKNTADCTFNVTVIDDEDPTITCPMDVTVGTSGTIIAGGGPQLSANVNGDYNCDAIVSYVVLSQDNCPDATITPLMTGTNATAYTNPNGNRVTHSSALFSGTFAKTTVNEAYSITDCGGQTAMCGFSITVVDDEMPDITCPANITLGTDGTIIAVDPTADPDEQAAYTQVIDTSNDCAAIVSFVIPGANDNCPDWSVANTQGMVSGSNFGKGVTTQVYTITDCGMNTDDCTFEITVIDNEPATLICPPTISMSNDLGLCSAVVTGITPTIVENCPINTATSVRYKYFNLDQGWNPGPGATNFSAWGSAAVLEGTVFPVGVTLGTYEVIDCGTFISSCNFQVIINDIEFARVTCPADVTIVSGTGGPIVAVGNNAVVSGGNVNDPLNPGFVTVQHRNGMVPPVNLGTDSSTGDCVAIVTWDTPAISDNCPFGTITGGAPAIGSLKDFFSSLGPLNPFANDKENGDAFDKGLNTVGYYVQDQGSNVTICQFTVTVIDNEAPEITCPASITVNSSMGSDMVIDDCQACLTYLAPVATFENCFPACPVTIVNTFNGTDNASGCYAVGTHAVTYTITDDAGLTAGCSFNVTIIDDELPQITCPASVTQNADPGVCEAAVTGLQPQGSFDNCGIAGITNTFNGTNNANGTYPVGTTPVTYTITDVNGNVGTCMFSVTIVDNQPPTLTCPSAVTMNSSMGADMMPGDCGAVSAYPFPTAADNCMGATVTQTDGSGLSTGSLFPVGVTSQTFLAVDLHGNMTTCGFDVTVFDDEVPTITCPADINDIAVLGECSRQVWWATPPAADNCPGAPNNTPPPAPVTVTRIFGDFPGAQFPVGTSKIRYRATDGSGNIAECEFDITIRDQEPPLLLNCPVSTTVKNNPGMCAATVCWNPPTPSDNCPGFILVNSHFPCMSNGMPVGNNAVSYIVTDASGNTAGCFFNVTVDDDEDPTIACPADMTVNTTNGCDAQVMYATPTVGVGGTGDNCPAAVVTQTAGLGSGSMFSVGTTCESYTITDASGRSAACTFCITVKDTGLPNVVCPADVTLCNDAGLCTAMYSYMAPNSNDNCTATTTTQTGGLAPAGANYPLGATVNTFQAMDGNGNVANCSFTVTVDDCENPTINCPANMTLPNDPGLCGAFHTFATPAAADNCPGAVVSKVSGSSSPFYSVGSSYPYTYQVTDAGGNVAQCSFTIEVFDTEAPTLLPCPSNINLSAEPGRCVAVANWNIPVAGDNCSGAVNVTASHNPGLSSGFPVGCTNVEYTAVDAAGNGATCTFTVCITDNENPTIVCPSAITVSNDATMCNAVVTYPAPTTADNCPGEVVSLASGIGSGGTFPVGQNVEVLQVTDASGNIATCSFTIDVDDDEDPVLCAPGTNVAQTFPTGNAATQILSNATMSLPINVTDNFVIFDVNVPVLQGTHTWVGDLQFELEHPDGTRIMLFDATIPCGNVDDFNFGLDDASTNGAPGCPPTSGLVHTPDVPLSTFNGKNSAGTWTLHITDNVGGDQGELLAVELEVLPFQLSDIVVNAPIGQCDVVVTYNTPSATDNCPGVSVGLLSGTGSGGTFPIGDTRETYTAVDAGGRVVDCSFNVTVNDVEPPAIVCPPGQTVNVGVATTTNTLNTNAVSNNGSGGTKFNILNTSANAVTLNEVNPVLNATGAGAQTVEVWYTFNVAQTSGPPSITAANGWQLHATVTGMTGARPSTSIVPIPNLIIPPGTLMAMYIGGSGGVGYHTHAAGDPTVFTDGTLIIQVGPNTGYGGAVPNPPFTPRDYTGGVTYTLASAGAIAACDAMVTIPLATATDCQAVTIANDFNANGADASDTYPGGTTTVVFTATDASGNASNCSIDITVVDNVDPTITCPADINVNNDAGSCDAVIAYVVTGDDNCASNITRTTGLASGSAFPVGNTVVTHVNTDPDGNTATCSFNVTVNDTELPVICGGGVPANISVNANAGLSCGEIVTFNSIVGTDNCPGAVTNLVSSPQAGLLSGSVFPVGVTQLTWTVTDASGNTADCGYTVTVTDNVAPSLNCPSDINVGTDAGVCNAIVNYAVPVGMDNCPGPVVTLTNGIGNGGVFPLGTTTEMYRVVDASGNEVTCSFMVTVSDLEAPQVTCMNTTFILPTPNSTQSVIPTDVFGGGFDNCGTVTPISVNPFGRFTCADIGNILVTLTVQDNAGNQATCVATITIDGCNPLPIDLYSFTGYNNDGVNILEWITIAEYNSDYFILEKSVDGTNFEFLAQVKAAGNSTQKLYYSEIDENPVNGANYYRLKMVDQDGTFDYSETVVIDVSWSLEISTIIPNPTLGEIDVMFTSSVDGKLVYKVYSMTGQLVRTEQISASKGMNTIHVDMSDLARGVYNFTIENGDARVIKRVIKQ